MKKKQIILTGIILIILVALILVLIFNNKGPKDEDKLMEAAKEYFEETLNTEVYVETLVENGYLQSSDKKCILLKKNEKDIQEENGDCNKADEEAKKPIILIKASNGFKIDEWNNKGATLTYSLKNGGNSHYSEKNVTYVTWIDSSGDEVKNKSLNIPSKDLREKYILYLEFNNGEYVLEKEFEVKVNVTKPFIENKRIRFNHVEAIYKSESGIDKIFYAVSEEDKLPNKKDMQESLELDMKCRKKYYAYSYAIDNAGNESDVEFIGSYEVPCRTIQSAPTVPVTAPNED